MPTTVKVAIQGCCHGELSKIYDQLTQLPQSDQPELLIICGDFQCLRDESDYTSLNVPDKYKKLGSFQDYYQGKSKAPILTIFIGGNHEASDFLMELPFGGWVAENIYYLGFSNVIWFKGLRIAGISGIFKHFDFYKSHFEKLPLLGNDVKSCYHTRFEDELKMLLLLNSTDLNCFVSHDWPVGVTDYGNLHKLLKIKPFFKEDIQRGQLGSRMHWDLLQKLKPNYWFAAHLHVKFEAVVTHENLHKRKLSVASIDENKKVKNEEEIELDLDDFATETNKNDDEISLSLSDDDEEKEKGEEHPAPPIISKGFKQTNFLALDKCTRRNENLQILDIPLTAKSPSENSCSSGLYYDEQFLKINKFMESFKQSEFFKNLKWNDCDDTLIQNLHQEISAVKLVNVGTTDGNVVPSNFERSVENPKAQTQLYIDKFIK